MTNKFIKQYNYAEMSVLNVKSITVKHKLKTVLLNAQKQFDKSIWFPNNHDLSGISF